MKDLSSPRRVAITGIGAVTSLGNRVDAIWRNILDGRSGVDYIRQFDSRSLPVQIGSEVDLKNLPEQSQDTPADHQRTARFGVCAAFEAWKDAAIERHVNRSRAGVCLGASVFPVIEDRLDSVGRILSGNDVDAVAYLELWRQRPRLLTQIDAASISNLLSQRFGLTRCSLTVQAACSSATQAIGHAFTLIRRGAADVMLTGGSDSMMSLMPLTGFTLLGSLSQRNSEPSRASRPFDRKRDGFVLGEGAAVFILEELNAAVERGATIHAEIIGYGSSGDAYRFTDIHPDGRGAVQCMQAALDSARVRPQDVGYINAHGTSTLQNDRIETAAIKQVFGAHAHQLAISSTKSQLGHLICAAGAIELMCTALALREGVLPPTINLDFPDPECDLDYVPNEARRAQAEVALSNSFGFGGQNGTLVLRRWVGQRTQAVYRPIPSPPKRAVVVTGLGVVSALGLNVAQHFRRLVRGDSGVGPLKTEAICALPLFGEARVEDFQLKKEVPHRMLRKLLTRSASFAVSAAGQALRDARLSGDALQDCDLCVGSLGLDLEFKTFSESLQASLDDRESFQMERYGRNGMYLLDPLFLVKSLPNSGLCGIAIQYGMGGANLNIMNGAVSALQAVAEGASRIRKGEADLVLAGGYDCLLQTETAIQQLLSGQPTGVCGPPDSEPSGYALGEGSAFFVLEEASRARARSAASYAELLGEAEYARPTREEADHQPPLLRAARLALGSAGIEPGDVEAVFGDGLAGEPHDSQEAKTGCSLFGESRPLYSAATWSTGFCGVASGAFSLLHALLAVSRGVVPPTLYNHSLKSQWQLQHLAKARSCHVRRALIWNSDRGQDNVALVVGEPYGA